MLKKKITNKDGNLKSGQNELFTNPDADAAREFFRTKSRALKPKLSTVEEVVKNYLHDGDYIGIGGFGAIRIPTAILHEIIRQKKKHLGFAGHTSTHDFQILAAGECFDKCDIAYIVGLEARGLSPNSRRYIESGKVKITEWSNATLSWRIKAAAMGLSFLPARNLMGTDTFKYSASKEIICPFTGQKYMAHPALYPDFAAIHVHECDVYGNAHIYGASVSDQDLAKASRYVVLTTEKIIPTEKIRQNPEATSIPFWCVDAVVEIPYGSYPGNMPYEYFSDEEYLRKWLTIEKDPTEFKKFIDKQIFGTKNFFEYLELNGGMEKMKKLRAIELLYDQK
ncbi:MAG: glutaconate CoA-transferase [Smithella sp. SDB]|nr:MAG: glutaconate CoA-transferase [Smithella sp. SDB]